MGVYEQVRELAIQRLKERGFEHPAECEHRATEIRFKPDAVGRRMYKRQCKLCGASTTSQLRHADVERMAGLLERVPAWDDEAEERLHERQSAWWEALREEQQAIWDEGRAERQNEYADYLASPQWAQLRAKVLKRANGICEGCLERPATQVHHVSYEHRGAEFAFELVAICSTCHRRLHTENSE